MFGTTHTAWPRLRCSGYPEWELARLELGGALFLLRFLEVSDTGLSKHIITYTFTGSLSFRQRWRHIKEG